MSTYDWRNDPNLNQDQKEAFARAERLHGGSKDADAPEGFLSSGYNAVARGLSNLRNIPTVSMAEDFSALAEQNQDLTKRAESGELSFLERMYYGKNYNRSDDQIDQTQGLSAEYAGAAAQRQSDAYASYPMSERGREGLQSLQQSKTFGDVGSAILNDPLGVASGVAQVAVEQAPTIAASALAARLGGKQAAINLFATSGYSQERYGQLINEASKSGYDLSNPDQARAAIEDREFMQRQAQRGFTRGIIIGAVDLLTMSLASKAPLTLKGVGANTAAQFVGGGTGEFAAELADTGEINPGEIAIESLAEGVTAPVDVAALGLGRNSETKLDSNAASAQTADELALQAEQQAEQVAIEEQAVAQEQSRKEMLQRNVDQFPAREEYKAARKKARVADLDDTTSELHNTYRQWKMENNLLLKTGSKEDAAAKKRFLKETTPENEDDQLNLEHEQALEAFAVEREAKFSAAYANVQVPTMQLGEEGATAALKAALADPLANELPSPINLNETSGPMRPQDPGFSVTADSNIIPPSASTAAMEAQVQGELPSPLVMGEDGAMQAGLSNQPAQIPQLAPDILRAVEAARLKEAGKAPKVKAGANESSKPAPVAAPKADPAAMKVYSQKMAIAKVEALAAAEVLPDNWSSAFPELDSALNAAKFKLKPFNEALEAALNPQAVPEVTEPSVNTLAEEGTTEEAAPTITDPKALKLSEAQTRINKVLDDHFTGDKQSALEEVYAGGEFLTENIATLAGVKSKQHVATSIDRFKTKFLEAQGLLKPRASKTEKDAAVAKFSGQLKAQAEAAKQDRIKASQAAATVEDAAADISQTADTAEQNVDGSITETVDRDPSSAENLGDVSDDGEGSASIFAEVGIDSTVASVGQGNYTGVDAEDKAFTKSQTTDDAEVADVAAKQNAKNLQRNIDFAMQEVDARMVFSEWDALKSDSTPAFAKVSKQDRYDWMMSVLEYQESTQSPEDLQLLTADLREIEQRLEETANDARTTESNQGSATQSEKRTDEARAPPEGSQGQGSAVDSKAGADTSQNGETTGVQDAAKTAPVVGPAARNPDTTYYHGTNKSFEGMPSTSGPKFVTGQDSDYGPAAYFSNSTKAGFGQDPGGRVIEARLDTSNFVDTSVAEAIPDAKRDAVIKHLKTRRGADKKLVKVSAVADNKVEVSYTSPRRSTSEKPEAMSYTVDFSSHGKFLDTLMPALGRLRTAQNSRDTTDVRTALESAGFTGVITDTGTTQGGSNVAVYDDTVMTPPSATPRKAPVVETKPKKKVLKKPAPAAPAQSPSAQKEQKRRAGNAINAQQFKDSYNSSSLDDMKSNPALAKVVEFADYLNSLTDAQWAKITPTFGNDKNPFKAPSMDVEQIRGFIDNTLNEPDAPKVSTGTRFSFKDLTGNDFNVDPKPKTGSREVFEKLIKELTGKSKNWRVKVFDNESDVVAQRILKNLGGDALANVKSGASFGWVSEDSNGTTTAHFILSNIAAGGERAAFMHEVGSHLGIDQMVDVNTRARLELRINEWASQNDNSLESIISKKALERVQNAAQVDDRMAKDPEIVTSETLAYFLEEATAMGVEPNVKTPIGRLLRELYALFKKALRKIKYNTDNLTAQDVVDLAQGAARISLRARKHGATADFRRFNHAYMGMGEGAQAYGWGTYLAERFSIARWYLRQDEKRKAKDGREAALSDPNNPSNRKFKLEDLSQASSEAIQSFKPGSKYTITSLAELQRVNDKRLDPLGPPLLEFSEAINTLTGEETVSLSVSYPTQGGTRVTINPRTIAASLRLKTGSSDAGSAMFDEILAIQNQGRQDYAAYRKTMGVEGNMVFVDTLVEDKDMLPWGSEIYKNPAIEDRLTKMFLSLPPIDAFNLLDYIFSQSPVLSDPNTSDITSRMNEITKRHDPLLMGNPAAVLFDANNPGTKADKDKAKAALTSDLTDFLGETFMSASGWDVYRGMEKALKFHPRSSAMLSNMANQLSDKSKSKPAFRGKNSFSGQEDMVISMLMDDFGVKGIIFPDAGTLGATSADSGLAYNNVVFDEDNLIVVGRTPGKSVSDKKNTVDEIRYGIKESWAAKTQGPKVKPFLTNAKFIAKAGTRSLKFLHQIVDQSREKMPAVGRWYDGMLAAEATRNEIRRSFEDIAIRATNLDPARLDAVNDFIGKSTFFQKWAYDPEIKGRTVKIDPIMKRIFDGLNENEQQLAKDVFAHGENMRQRKIAIAKALGVDKKFFTEAALEGPYAPLKRFGNFAGELKSQQLVDAENKRDALDPKAVTKQLREKINKLKSDPDHYAISFFDTPGAAEQFVDANRDKYAFGEWSEREADIESDRISNPAVYEKVLGALKAGNNSAIPGDAKKAFQDMVKNLYFQSLDERSARLSGSRRMSRAGYDKNMMRSFLSHARAEASLISQMENGADINAALAEARPTSGARKEEIDTYNMIVKHYKDTLNQVDTPIQDRIAAANSVYMLTTSIGYHLTNATQPIMVTVPRIAGNFNDYSGTWAALFKGYGVARNIIDGSFLNQVKTAATVGLIGTNQVGINIEKAPPEYRKMLEYLQLHQLLDVGMEEDLGNLDKFDFGYDSINKASDFLGGMTHRLYQVARYVEAHNRVSSAIAAYDMAKKNPGVVSRMKMTPMEYATAVVQDTQGNFSRLDAPLLLKALPKVTVQYRKYQFLMAWHYTDAFKQLQFGSQEEKAVGGRILGYSLAHAGLAAGATGIPMLGSLYWAFATMLGDEDEPEDLERYIRSKIENEKLADVLSRGLPAFLGVDMSTKLSQGKIFQPLPYVDFEASEDGIKDVWFGLLGPVGTTAANFTRAAGYMEKGDMLKAVEYSVPKGVRSATETFRLATEGFSLSNGDVVIDPREINIGSLMLNAMGLPATEINKIKWTRGQQFELMEYFSNESSRLRRDYVDARRDRDRAKQKELREEWRELQVSKDRIRPFFNNDRGTLKRQPISDLMKASRRQSKREDKSRKQLTGN